MAAPTAKPKSRLVTTAVASAGLALIGIWMGSRRLYVYGPVEELHAVRAAAVSDGLELDELEAETEKLRKQLASMSPRSVHIVVDTSHNRLFVKKGNEVLLEAVCSTGSGGRLKDPDSDREWLFETPRGVHRVREKKRDPVWTKPDWAFIEEAKPVPKEWSERRDTETLGDYALYFGDGYMIHGTLYQRYLGRAITHGCIRLGDEDLKRVYEMTPVGSPIYIF